MSLSIGNPIFTLEIRDSGKFFEKEGWSGAAGIHQGPLDFKILLKMVQAFEKGRPGLFFGQQDDRLPLFLDIYLGTRHSKFLLFFLKVLFLPLKNST